MMVQPQDVQVGMMLSQLLADIGESLCGVEDARLSGLCLDSRRIQPGDLFMACLGDRQDGRQFIPQALARGAAAVLVEADAQWQSARMLKGVPVVPVTQLHARLVQLAANFYQHPARAMALVGVTGTNGKTSCCHFIAQLQSLQGKRWGLGGTLGYGVYGSQLSMLDAAVPATTPDALTLQAILQQLREAGAEGMVMEVSSHGLVQQRVDPDDYAIAVFTNLSRDHLDYHGSMEAYGAAKARLFSGKNLRLAVVNQDDPFSATILKHVNSQARVLTYSLEADDAAISLRQCEWHRGGMRGQFHSPWGQVSLESALLGRFNASNLLAAMAVSGWFAAESDQLDLAALASSASHLQSVPGRMQVLGDQRLPVIVDYAHTPDALGKVLQAMRVHYGQARIWTVFGCGGNRDRGKRPLMGEVVERFSDRIIVTDDNPRLENNTEIIRQILLGMNRPERALVIHDRAIAIETAVAQAEAGDVILVAGKGHEDYQDVAGQRLHFSDVEHVALALEGQGLASMGGSH